MLNFAVPTDDTIYPEPDTGGLDLTQYDGVPDLLVILFAALATLAVVAFGAAAIVNHRYGPLLSASTRKVLRGSRTPLFALTVGAVAGALVAATVTPAPSFDDTHRWAEERYGADISESAYDQFFSATHGATGTPAAVIYQGQRISAQLLVGADGKAYLFSGLDDLELDIVGDDSNMLPLDTPDDPADTVDPDAPTENEPVGRGVHDDVDDPDHIIEAPDPTGDPSDADEQ